MNDKAMREAFERWMVDTAKCVVGSIDPYAKGIEDRNWTVWQAAWRAHSGEAASGPITIVAAAIQTPDGEVFTAPAPARHHHTIWHICEARGVYPAASEQGFLDSTGRFLRRTPAGMIAARAGQLKRGLTAPPRLYSEDLW